MARPKLNRKTRRAAASTKGVKHAAAETEKTVKAVVDSIGQPVKIKPVHVVFGAGVLFATDKNGDVFIWDAFMGGWKPNVMNEADKKTAIRAAITAANGKKNGMAVVEDAADVTINGDAPAAENPALQ